MKKNAYLLRTSALALLIGAGLTGGANAASTTVTNKACSYFQPGVVAGDLAQTSNEVVNLNNIALNAGDTMSFYFRNGGPEVQAETYQLLVDNSLFAEVTLAIGDSQIVQFVAPATDTYRFKMQHKDKNKNNLLVYEVTCVGGGGGGGGDDDDDDDDDDFDDIVRKKFTNLTKAFLSRRLDRMLAEEPDRPRLLRRRAGQLGGGSAAAGLPVMGYGSDTAGGMRFGGSLIELANLAQSDRNATEISDSIMYFDPDSRRRNAMFGKQDNRYRQGVAADPVNGRRNDQPSGANEAAVNKAATTPRPVVNTGFNVWAEGHYSWYKDDVADRNTKGRFATVYVGADYLFGKNLLVGFLAQYDYTREKSRQTEIKADGDGWMIGPYVSIGLSENIFFDARAAFGQSSNKIRAAGDSGEFDTNRWLVRAALVGTWTVDAWRFTPQASVVYAEERQKSYRTASDVEIPAQTVSLGRVTAGPEIAYRFDGSDGSMIEPFVSLLGVWDFKSPGSVTVAGESGSFERLRAQAELGFIFGTPGALTARASVAYDGIGTSKLDAFSARLWFNLSLN